VGNLNDYVKYQMGEAMAKGGEAGAAVTVPAQMAMGFGMAQEMMKQMQQPQQPAAVPVAAPAGPAPTEMLTPAQVAEILSVTEADVIASIEGGNLKAKKIGAVYRISRPSLDAFLAE